MKFVYEILETKINKSQNIYIYKYNATKYHSIYLAYGRTKQQFLKQNEKMMEILVHCSCCFREVLC